MSGVLPTRFTNCEVIYDRPNDGCQVVRAYDQETEQAVVVKIDAPKIIGSEMHILHHLKSDHKSAIHVVTLLDVGSNWLCLEPADTDLFNVILSSPKFTMTQVKAISHVLVNTVHYLHQKGVIHLDVKPENILINQKGDPESIRICDFGTGMRIEPQLRELRFNCAGLGTNEYADPEVFHDYPVNPWLADVYSLGVILWILVTKQPPYRRSSLIPYAEFRSMECDVPPPLRKVDNNFKILWTKGVTELAHARKLDLDTELLSLLEHMLCPQKTRWSLTQILAHPWFS